MRDDLVVFSIPHDASDSDLFDLMLVGYRHVMSNPEFGCFVTIDGYDADPRSLYEIPEVHSLCQRMIGLGFLSILHPSTLLDEKFNNPQINKDAIPFGAFELWAIATGLLDKAGQFAIEHDKMTEFWKLLHEQNKKCQASCEPLLGSLKQQEIKPGCYRHSTFNFSKN